MLARLLAVAVQATDGSNACKAAASPGSSRQAMRVAQYTVAGEHVNRE